MKCLILVRHGETEWNAAQRLQGHSDIALNPVGRAQARALAPLVSAQSPDLSFCSDLQRAVETSALLGHADALRMSALREQGLGDWEGCNIADLVARAPDDYRDWRAGRYAPPGAESWGDFRGRVEAALTEALAECRSVALVTCHGGVIRAALDALIGLAPARVSPATPASMTILTQDGSDFRLESLNTMPPEVPHLPGRIPAPRYNRYRKFMK